MKNGITYNGRSYSHRQYWRLIRDLTANGWTVTICAQEDRRAPWIRQVKPDAFWCYVKNGNMDYLRASSPSFGRTPWDALKSAVIETVKPAEWGLATKDNGR